MIKLSEGELLDLLPSQMKTDPDMICLSYALKCAVEDMLEYEKGTMTQNFIESLPEKILDVLVVELRSPYYLQDMDIETKRKIIADTLVWHTKAGTPSAVSEMIAAVFGNGYVVEWFNFTEGDQTPGYFDIVTSARMTEDIVDYFMRVIERVKNERSHIRRVLIERSVHQNEYVGSGATSSPKVPVTNNKTKGDGITESQSMASGVISEPHEIVGNCMASATRSLAGGTKVALAFISTPKEVILNGNQNKAESVAKEPRAAVGAMSNPIIHI